MNDDNDTKRLTKAQRVGKAPMPHPLTPEANKEPHPGEISEPDNLVEADGVSLESQAEANAEPVEASKKK